MKQTMEILKKHRLILMAWAFLVLISSQLKLGFLVGSQEGSLSLIVSTLPVIAYFFPFHIAAPFAGAAWLLSHLTWPIPLTLGIPTLFATLSWKASKENKGWMDTALHLILPLSCIAAFCASSAGSQAWPYSLYWLIPAALFFVPMGLVGRALKSTFVAHAVGSVIWVNMIDMAPESWMLLIPVVAVERLVAASWSVLMIGTLAYAKTEMWSLNQETLQVARSETL